MPPQLWAKKGHPFENSAPIYKRQPSGAKNQHQTHVPWGERDEILPPDILSLNESHPFLKSPLLNPGCRNIAALTYQKNHSRGCLTWKFMVSLYGCIFYDPGIRTWWCSVAKGMLQKVTTWWNLGKWFLELPVFRVSCSQRESMYVWCIYTFSHIATFTLLKKINPNLGQYTISNSHGNPIYRNHWQLSPNKHGPTIHRKNHQATSIHGCFT